MTSPLLLIKILKLSSVPTETRIALVQLPVLRSYAFLLKLIIHNISIFYKKI